MVGYTREELDAGLIHWDAMTPPEYAHADVVAMERAIQDGTIEPWEKEYYLDTPRTEVAGILGSISRFAR